jgi:hypothetical protein
VAESPAEISPELLVDLARKNSWFRLETESIRLPAEVTRETSWKRLPGYYFLTKADLFPSCPRLCIDNDEPEALEQSAEFKVQVCGFQTG